MTYELLQQLIKGGKFMPNTIRRLKTLSEEQIRWVIDSDGKVTNADKLESLHRSFSIHADAEAEKCTGNYSYTWQKVVTAVVSDCADKVVEMDLSEAEEKCALFELLRESLVGQEAARLIEQGNLQLADVETGKLLMGKARSLAYVRSNAFDKKMNALEAWYMASSFRSGTISCSSANLYGQTIRAVSSRDPADIEAWNQKVSQDWMKSICGKYPDRLAEVDIQEEQREFPVGIGERINLDDDGVWCLRSRQGELSPAPIGIVLAALLTYHKEEVINLGGKTMLTVFRGADTLCESIWQQFKLHKAYRASGHEAGAPLPLPEPDEGDIEAKEVIPEEVLQLAMDITERSSARLEMMPVWCLQHEVPEIAEHELMLVRASKRDLCGFHPIFKEAQHPGLFFIGSIDDFNAKFDKQRSALTKFLSSWRANALKAMEAGNVRGHGRGSRGGRAGASSPDTGRGEPALTNGAAKDEFWARTAPAALGKGAKAGVVRLSALQGEVEEQMNLIQKQLTDRMEALAGAHVQQVAQLRAVTEVQIQSMQDSFQAQMDDIQAQASAQMVQLGKMARLMAGK